MPGITPLRSMPRPSADLPDRAALATRISAGEISLRVTPGARSESIRVESDHVAVKVRARPENGAANAATEKLVARVLGVATSRCRIVRGATSRAKVLSVSP
jgi:uncharacterized protein YggU (UPF0235/DUF167 family)